MNTFETAKKIKWIIQKIQRDKRKGFSVKLASLYQENDEDKEVWMDYIEKDNFDNLTLFAAIIECDYFQLEIQVREKEFYLGLFKMGEDKEFDYERGVEETTDKEDGVRLFFEHLHTAIDGNEFSPCDTTEKAYESILRTLQHIKGT